MSMPPFTVRCTAPGCSAPAAFKVAAEWSDGTTKELKTYGLSCGSCLADQLAAARRRRAKCGLASNETLAEPIVYALKANLPAR